MTEYILLTGVYYDLYIKNEPELFEDDNYQNERIVYGNSPFEDKKIPITTIEISLDLDEDDIEEANTDGTLQMDDDDIKWENVIIDSVKKSGIGLLIQVGLVPSREGKRLVFPVYVNGCVFGDGKKFDMKQQEPLNAIMREGEYRYEIDTPNTKHLLGLLKVRIQDIDNFSFREGKETTIENYLIN